MKKIALLMAVIFMFSFSSCAGKKADLNIALGESKSVVLDPAKSLTADSATIVLHNFEGLYTLDKNGAVVPGQAKDVEISADKLVYTFHLRDNLKWSDGKELTAGDFVYSWNRAIDSKTGSGYEYLFDAIKGYKDGKLDINAPDNKTLVVTLNAATPQFLELTTYPVFSPVRGDIVANEKWSEKAKTCIGNGPYKITGISGKYVSFQKNSNYWNNNAIVSNSIKFSLLSDSNAYKSYKKNNLQFINNVPSEEKNNLKNNPDYHQKGQLGTYFLNFNINKAPFNNVLVRQALTLAIDRNYIVNEIVKSGIPASAFVPNGFSDSVLPNEFRTVGGNFIETANNSANYDKASELLKQAGFEGGKGLPALEYTYNEGTINQAIAEALKNMWGKIGVKVELTSAEWKSFLTLRKNGSFLIAKNEFIGDYNNPLSFLDKFTTGSAYNEINYSNADYDNLVKQAKAAADNTERIRLLHNAEDILMKNWTVCPIYFYSGDYLQNGKLKDVYVSPQGYKYFMYASMTK